MTKRITHIAKPLLPATLTLSALLSMAACSSDATKPSASAATTTAAAPVGAPATTPSQPGNASGSGTATANPTAPTATQPQAPAQPTATASKAAKPASKPSTTKGDSNSGSGLPGDCTAAHLKGTVTGLTNPVNHVLLTVTNTGTTTCNLYYYPNLRLDADQQSVTQAVEDSKPQAVVTINPGESAYAAIGTSSGDGSGDTPHLEKQVQVFLETRDQSGSLPGSMTLPLPAGTYVSMDKAFVTYWQSDLQSATAW